jgi:predicted nicotinamide N-methyase
VPFVPEIRLYQADESTGLWDATGGEYHSDRPPPFWAFAWAGGLALARYVLDRPETVAGRRVLDIASGSGLVAIAAALAGAASVRAVDVSPDAVAVARRNARANGVTITATVEDIHDSVRPDRDGSDGGGRPADVVLAGDVFYTEAVAERALRFLRYAGRDGARVLVGDPDRSCRGACSGDCTATTCRPAGRWKGYRSSTP